LDIRRYEELNILIESIDKQSIGLSIILPLLGKDIFLEGALKLMPIDLDVPYEFLIMYDQVELDLVAVRQISDKYHNVRFLEKNNNTSTLSALQQGIDAATAEYILVVCTDIIGPIITINQMLSLAKEGCDFINCTRYAAGGRYLGGSCLETILSRLANWILHFAGCAFTDATLGLKLFRKDIFKQLQLQSNSTSWVIALEMALKAQSAGLRLAEVATIAVDRFYGGYSTRNHQDFFKYTKCFFLGCIGLHRATANKLSTPTCPIQISD